MRLTLFALRSPLPREVYTMGMNSPCGLAESRLRRSSPTPEPLAQDDSPGVKARSSLDVNNE
jgi:hypothetical protein